MKSPSREPRLLLITLAPIAPSTTSLVAAMAMLDAVVGSGNSAATIAAVATNFPMSTTLASVSSLLSRLVRVSTTRVDA